jgi:hypothetical protein
MNGHGSSLFACLFDCTRLDTCDIIRHRCRHGFFEIINNDYTHWEMYAIGGSAEPTIVSRGNRYTAPSNPFAKDVREHSSMAP